MSVRVFYNQYLVQRLQQAGIVPRRQLPSGPSATAGTAAAPGPRTALQLAEDCGRLRAENDRLRQENQRLTEELGRATRRAAPTPVRSDDDALVQRFALLELD